MRAGQRVALWIYDCPDPQQTIEQRHLQVVDGMRSLESPFGWKDMVQPQCPVREKGSLAAFYSAQYPSQKVLHREVYHIRDAKFIYDKAACDDSFSFDLELGKSELDYSSIVWRYFPELVAAIGGYRAVLYFNGYFVTFDDLHLDERKRLLTRDSIDINGRNNIFTLHPAQYWDAELCRQALGYSRDEVIRRLDGKVPLVKPLMDGVYVVFNDNPDLTFEEFCAMNDRFKPILGLV